MSKITPSHKTCARHREMVLDPLRTPLLKAAIMRTVKPGDVVADIGCGIGILSFLALEAGAKKIHAIDTDAEAIKAAKFFADKLNYSKQINFINGLSFSQKIPERVDVILCEIIGSLGFEENFLPTLIDARKRFLKPDGKMVPESIELWGALASESAQYQGWADVAGLDLRAATPPLTDWKAIAIAPNHLLSAPQCLTRLDTATVTSPKVHIKTTFKATRPGPVGGLALWPRIEWHKSIVTDASPMAPLTHWKQAYLPLTPQNVTATQSLEIELVIQPDPKEPQLRTEILWRS